MLYIQEPYSTFFEVVPQQDLADDTRFRLLNCSLTLKVNEGTLLYNTLTCELVLLTNEETEAMSGYVAKALPEALSTNDYLVRHWFLVPYDFDDRKFILQCRDIITLLATQEQPRYNFTIFTTTDCNARCFYCFQKGRPHVFMSHETADKIADYIINEYNTHLKDKGQQLLLQWFGGEPLYNSKIITLVCQRLADAGADYRSSTISNGYLFTPQLVREARDLWHLKKIQITLDGTEHVYNRVKRFIYTETEKPETLNSGTMSPFLRVLDNIDLLLSAGIEVTVRLNTDAYNVDDLMTLADELGQRYAGKKNFSCYARALFENEDRKESHRSDEHRTLVYDKLSKLERRLIDRHIASLPSLQKSPRLVFCKADADNGFTFLPDGSMGLCDFYTETNFVSHIDNPTVIDQKVADSFKEHCDDLPICDDCPIYPQCIRLRKCGEENCCFPQMKAHHIKRLKLAMLVRYKRWLKHPQADPDPDADNYAETGNC